MRSVLTVERDSDTMLREGVERQPLVMPGLMSRACASVALRSALYRRALMRKPLFCSISNAHHRVRLARHADRRPRLEYDDGGVVAELRATGVAVRTLELPAGVLACADGVVDRLRARETNRPGGIVAGCELSDYPELVLWGLSPRLLDLAENYIGLPVRYHGLEVKRESVDSEIRRTRRWHLDDEDRCMLKVVIYLSDVDTGSAPFGYVERCNSEQVRQLIRRAEDPVPDDAMQAVVPSKDWKRVTGPRLTSVYADTAQVFHRVFPAEEAERFSVTFVYSSRSPYFSYSRLQLPPRGVLENLRNELTARQWDALCVGRRRRNRAAYLARYANSLATSATLRS